MAVSNISSHALGKLVQISFADGVRDQLSKYSADFDNILKSSVGDIGGSRSHEFALQTSGGPNAIQAMPADGSSADLPTGQLSEVGFYEAVYKRVALTIQLPLDLWQKTMDAPGKYADAMILESKNKAVVAKREMCIFLHGDGTGKRVIVSTIVGTVTATTGLASIVGATAVASVSHVGWLQEGDLCDVMVNTATSAAGVPSAVRTPTVAAGTFSHWKVSSRNLRTDTIILVPINTLGAATTLSDLGSIVATDVLYKKNQNTVVATNAAISTDHNLLTEVPAGLESIMNDDGRVCHGVTMSGVTAGTNYTASGLFDPDHILEAVTDLKTLTGDQYNYTQMLMAPKVHDIFVKSVDANKIFRDKDPKGFGGKGFFYQHGNTVLMLQTSEFCPPNRIRVLPEGQGDDQPNPIEFRGEDFKVMNVGGSEEFLATGSTAGRYKEAVQKFFVGRMCFLNKFPRAGLTIKGYDLV